ncbi:MAG: N-acyl-D-amino-acid deacylase family protein [Acidimicrobiales bacterium]
MHDLVIRSGLVVDGTGGPPRTADVAVRDGCIVELGAQGSLGPARRDIHAHGQLVLPGWVDIHTHYDGQATWDPYLTPSSWHGVTTTVFGNCGVGFAPVRAGAKDFLINLMEGVEDIPGTVLAEGVQFNWQSFPEYLDALEAAPKVMDIAAQIPHGALRFFVMGDRGADHGEIPTPGEIDEMGRLVVEALDAGALGFTTSRTVKHRAKDGRPTPSLSAGHRELDGIARAMGAAGKGVIQANSDFGPGEFDILRRMAELSGRPLSVLLLQVDNDPGLWRQTLDQIHQAQADGLTVRGQVGVRPIGVMMGLDATVHFFAGHPAYRSVSRLPLAERARALRTDTELRRRLIEERPGDAFDQWMTRALERTFELGDPPDYEPTPDRAIAARARATGTSPWELALDLLCGEHGQALLLHPFENYCGGDLEVVRTMLSDPHTVCGLADGGAHVATICDASAPTFLLTHWARDRVRGPKLPIELLVRKQTRDSALAYGLGDRGVIAPGYRADLNVVDLAALQLGQPHIVRDLPAGGKRLVQRATGYRHTFVAGVEVAANGEATGALPGTLVRGARG